MTAPLVSVVVPNHNYGRALHLCLGGLLAQTYPALEILLVDDCSTDDSVAVAEALGVPVVRTPANGGVAGARNLGASLARGEILCFVDSDVRLRPDAVANAVALLTGDPTLGAVCGNYDPEPLVADSRVEEYRALQQYHWLAGDEGRITTLYTAIMAIRADVFAEVGPFNPRLRHTEDADYGRRLSGRYGILLDPSVRGRHDHDDTLRVIARKVFHRSRLHVPFVGMRDGNQPRGNSSGHRLAGMLAAALAVGSVPTVLLGAWWSVLPVALVAAFLGSDPGIYRFVAGRKGIGFLPFFAGTYFLVNLVILAGLSAGVLQWLTSRRFRRTYLDAGVAPVAA
ncbi:glycosyltransferase family A protein [Longispora sp. NPDC051575]|uniref:glycosyltransferase family 2 protein n=1 Tax=Longispora sp. NPDC051575 TaxID=3154943 RepID=UPI003434A6AC